MPKPVTQLVFRAISHIITSPELYNRYGVQAEPATFILQEFQHQFFLETGFHSGMDCMRHRSFDLPFEATITTPYLTMAEVACPLLLRVSHDLVNRQSDILTCMVVGTRLNFFEACFERH